MKHFGMTLVAALCLTTASFAAGNQPTTEKWEGNINVEKLSRYLQLSGNQHEEDEACQHFQKESERIASQCHLWQLEVDEEGLEREAIC